MHPVLFSPVYHTMAPKKAVAKKTIPAAPRGISSIISEFRTSACSFFPLLRCHSLNCHLPDLSLFNFSVVANYAREKGLGNFFTNPASPKAPEGLCGRTSAS